jgi:hypothetical protein
MLAQGNTTHQQQQQHFRNQFTPQDVLYVEIGKIFTSLSTLCVGNDV